LDVEFLVMALFLRRWFYGFQADKPRCVQGGTGRRIVLLRDRREFPVHQRV